MQNDSIPFTRVHVTGREIEYIREAIDSNRLGGDGAFTKRCEAWLEKSIGSVRALLTHSCTAALEMAAILADMGPGDEVIMPSFTFASTANAFALRGATPVFVDIEPHTMNLDPERVKEAVTARTRAIVPVHYAGIACDMDALLEIGRNSNALIIEDAAQALHGEWSGRPLGSIGEMGALSFHETKNVTSGEGGCLLVNDPELIERAEIVREKGTDRGRFHRGQVDKYTWVEIGSSYLPSELTAAFLLAQLERSVEITAARRRVWDWYHEALESLENEGLLVRPRTGGGNAHIYFVLLPSLQQRADLIDALKKKGVSAVFHYVPLHNSPAGIRYGRPSGSLVVTEDLSDRLLRLPLWADMTREDVSSVVDSMRLALG
ncbi:MAG: dTDP-4-amino-4,6-dideoxygalactose transaminase [Acidobacteriota bacterium]|nr:dTDP-4-amino-4,6-dideoxygalactose transaminase [Acidobacteriota bacterium]